MAIQQLGLDGSTVQAIDPQHNAARSAIRPMQCLAWQSLAVATGAVTTLAAGAAIFSLRNVSANLLVVRRVGVGFVCTTAFTAAQAMGFSLFVARAFTASDASGTQVLFTGSNTKVRTSLGTPTSLDCRVSAAAALTAGTKVLDTNAAGMTGFYVAGVGTALAPAPNNLFSHDTGDHPIVLAQNEGINVTNAIVMGAAGVGTAYVSIEFAEVAAY